MICIRCDSLKEDMMSEFLCSDCYMLDMLKIDKHYGKFENPGCISSDEIDRLEELE